MTTGDRSMEDLFRAESARLVGWLTHRIGRFDTAEDAVAEAFEEALRRWPTEGEPQDPRRWLATVAHRRAIDRLRSADRRRERTIPDHASIEESVPDRLFDGWPDEHLDHSLRDEQLRLLFLCCHPALHPRVQIALTLKTIAGLSTESIARALLLPTPTVAQQLVRAKRKIRDAGIPFRTPADEELPDRLRAVLRIVYLIFNESYTYAPGSKSLGLDAIRLARLVVRLMPDEAEARGLLALCLFQDSRREARQSEDGLPIRLDRQDRSRWNRSAISEGERELDHALRMHRPGSYQIQAAIAALHSRAPDTAGTDWLQIAGLYEKLRDHEPGPITSLNHAVAIGMAFGPEQGLEAMETLADDPAMASYPFFFAARAQLRARARRIEEAQADLRRAISMAPDPTERAQLQIELEALRDPEC